MNGKVFCFNDKMGVPEEEAYELLWANVKNKVEAEKIKAVTVTSCNPDEGKTEVSLKFSITAARLGIRVLLVDADLRKPMHLKGHGVGYSVGLSDMYTEGLAPDDIISCTNIENLFFVPCGRKYSNPVELLSSEKFIDFIRFAKERFGLVIIDTPSLSGVIDAAVVAAQTDGTVIVIESRSTKYRAVLAAKQQLDKVNARVLGVVLNKVRKRARVNPGS